MGFFKLAGMTIGSIFKKKETLKYPVQTKKAYKDQKGTIINAETENCTLCGICAKRCPANAISVDKEKKEWSINHFSCIQCGYCITACPKKCLKMSPNRPSISTDKNIETVKINKKEKKDEK